MMTQHNRSYTWDDPTPHIDKAKQMSGLEYMRAFINGEIPNAPIAQTMGFRGAEIEYGRVVFVGEPENFHLNPIGTIHGGFAATLLDSALACAVHTTLEQGMIYTTTQLNIHYVRTMMPNMGTIRCEGTVIHRGRKMATAEAEITDNNGKIYAHATTTCLILPIP
jgi:uncharacterized protein (TIGR00369 family)